MAVIFALSSQSVVPQPPALSAELAAIAAHLVLYGTLATLLAFATRAYWGGQALPWSTAVGITVVCIAYGISDEIHQSFVPGRSATVFDVVVDGIGAAMACVLLIWLTRRWSDVSHRRRVKS